MSGLELLPQQVTHRFGRFGWRCTVERQDERADLAAVLAEMGRIGTARHTTVVSAIAEAPAVGAAEASLIGTAGAVSTRVAWVEVRATGGEAEVVADVSAAPVHPAAIADVQVWVGGVKWRQSLVVISDNGETVAVQAPADPPGWVFAAGEVVEIRYVTGG